MSILKDMWYDLGDYIIFFLAILLIVLMIFGVRSVAYLNQPAFNVRALDAVTNAGFTDIDLYEWGPPWISCSSGDFWIAKMEATNSRGNTVDVAVCCGWWKKCTVRY